MSNWQVRDAVTVTETRMLNAQGVFQKSWKDFSCRWVGRVRVEKGRIDARKAFFEASTQDVTLPHRNPVQTT